jgi:hypothetical protein
MTVAVADRHPFSARARLDAARATIAAEPFGLASSRLRSSVRQRIALAANLP